MPSGGVTLKRRYTYRPSVIYLIVNKLLSLSLSLSRRPLGTTWTYGCVLIFYFQGHRAKPLTGLTGVRQKGGLPGPPPVCVLSAYFLGHRAEPLAGLLRRAPKGRPTGTPPRSPPSRIHRCPGGLYRGSIMIAQVGSCPYCVRLMGVLPGG